MGEFNESSICQVIKDFLVDQNIKCLDDITIKQNKTSTAMSFFGVSTIRVKCGEKKSYIEFKITSNKTLLKHEAMNLLSVKSAPSWMRLTIGTIRDVEKVLPLVSDLYNEAYEQIVAEAFSCCSRYVECSDAMKCTHPDRILAKGCYYRKNLENGLIFYGNNAVATHK